MQCNVTMLPAKSMLHVFAKKYVYSFYNKRYTVVRWVVAIPTENTLNVYFRFPLSSYRMLSINQIRYHTFSLPQEGKNILCSTLMSVQSFNFLNIMSSDCLLVFYVLHLNSNLRKPFSLEKCFSHVFQRPSKQVINSKNRNLNTTNNV